MPTNLNDYEKRDIYKSLIYKLCDFLIEKRNDPKYKNFNVTRPIVFPLKEMSTLFEYIGSSSKDSKINELKNVLGQLNEDSIEIDSPTTVISILNNGLKGNFISKYNANKEIKIKCSSEKLEEYKKKLKKLTEETPIKDDNLGIQTKIKIAKKIKDKYKNINFKFEEGKGFLQLNKGLEWILLGGSSTRTCKLVKYILEPTSKSKKVEDVFDNIRIPKDNKIKELSENITQSYQAKKKIIKNTVIELQKEKFLKGHIGKASFVDEDKTVTFHFK